MDEKSEITIREESSKLGRRQFQLRNSIWNLQTQPNTNWQWIVHLTEHLYCHTHFNSAALPLSSLVACASFFWALLFNSWRGIAASAFCWTEGFSYINTRFSNFVWSVFKIFAACKRIFSHNMIYELSPSGRITKLFYFSLSQS